LAGAWGGLGVHRERFFALGHYDNGGGPMFNMTALALRTSNAVNGVSQLHGEVTKQMWHSIWPGTPYESLPVRAITHGVDVPTGMSSEIGALLERYLGPDWLDHHDDPAVVNRVMEIPDEALWAARQSLRAFLFNFIRERARARWSQEHVSAARIVAAATMFD